MDKPFSQACENNKQPILDQLKRLFQGHSRVLEIGSGTGQHAAYFAPALPFLQWHTSDQPANHNGIRLWLKSADSANVHGPISFTIGIDDWPAGEYDAIFSANTAHIMQPQEVTTMMQIVARHLPPDGIFCQYGPFKINGHYTSESNREFDLHLHDQGYGGIRDVSELAAWASPLQLAEKIHMPANNLMLVWRQS